MEVKRYIADVCVYTGTDSGVMAAVAIAKRGKSVIIVEPSPWLGGFVGGGIRVLRDCRYPDEVGGLTRKVMEKDFEIGGGSHDHQWALREAFAELVKKHEMKVLFEHRLGRTEKVGNRITKLHLDYAPPDMDGCPAPEPAVVNSAEVTADVFIDAGYEGDLMAQAGVSYVVGREAMDQYGESLAGVRNINVFNVDPYVKPGDPSSGLLPMISPEPIGEIGSASRYMMAYNFRPLWKPPGEGTPLGEPKHYDPAQYELVHRALKTDPQSISWPHGNYDRRGLISGGIPGRQADYPDGDWKERAKIWREFVDHVKIMHKITGSQQTLQSGEYPGSGDFPNQLYIRLARRMISNYVMAQHDLMNQTDVDDPIGLGYGWISMVDIYPCRLVATPDGKVASEGEVFVRVCPGPYKIPYRSITPKSEECSNLLVSVCISASHVALSSVRMEPTYMLMGESAGIAAVRAIDEGKDVQNIDMATYRKELLDAGQILEWDGTGYGGERPDSFDQDRENTWWESHPEDYQERPVSTILKGPREFSPWNSWLEEKRREKNG